jgi:hypothetical protein
MPETVPVADVRAFARTNENLFVLVFDDFYRQPDAVRAIALRQTYEPDPTSDFPGLRSRQPTPAGLEKFFERATGIVPRRVETTLQNQPHASREQQFYH